MVLPPNVPCAAPIRTANPVVALPTALGEIAAALKTTTGSTHGLRVNWPVHVRADYYIMDSRTRAHTYSNSNTSYHWDYVTLSVVSKLWYSFISMCISNLTFAFNLIRKFRQWIPEGGGEEEGRVSWLVGSERGWVVG